MEMTVGCKEGQVGPVKAGTDAGEGMRGRGEQGKSGGKEGEGGNSLLRFSFFRCLGKEGSINVQRLAS